MSDDQEVIEPTFDFSSPEDVFVACCKKDDGKIEIDFVTVINQKDNIIGAASYDAEYGGFLDYTILNIVEFPPFEDYQYFVVEKVTGHYYKGDGWSSDDDMDFYYESVRLATKEEINHNI